MPGLNDVQDLLDRVARTPGLTLPETVTPARAQKILDAAEAIVLRKAGLEDPPADGTQDRVALADVAMRLAHCDLLAIILGTSAEERESLMKQRESILEEAEDLADDDADDEGPGEPWVDYVDTIEDEDGDT